MESYTIPGKPVPWKRARRNGNKYFNSQIKERDRYIKEIIIARKGSTIHSEPIKVTLECHMTIPKYWSTLRRLNAQGTPHANKPDIDNLTKFVYDSLTGVLWKDDRFIVESYSFKIYSSEPKTVIHIEEIVEIKPPICDE